MTMMDLGGKRLEVDDHGFIQDPAAWDDDVAAALARTEGVPELTPAHWKLVRFVREFYLEAGRAPLIRILCKKTGFNLKELYALFPSGPGQGVCKVAGLPRPDGCV